MKQKVAIVYDRVNKFGGAERVLLALHEMFPDAPLFTSVYNQKTTKWADVFPKIYTSFLQNVPILKNYHELLGWLTPLAFEQFKFDEYDLVISVTSEAAKGVITGTKTKHVCYMLTPTRYLWSGYDFYLNNRPQIFKIFPFYKMIAWPLLTYLKWWDKVAAQRPDKIIAISTEVQERIKKYYNRESEIVFPPCELHFKKSLVGGRRLQSRAVSRNFFENAFTYYYLTHGRFVQYKRLDLVLEVFKKNELPLVVSGTGSEFERLKTNRYKNIKFISNPSDEELIGLYNNAKAFLMPQEEDFGITSVEAQSFGIPVIAYKKGGSLDIVIDGKTGLFFDEQTPESLADAIAKFDTTSFDRRYLITNAKHFSKENFKKNLIRHL
jgi:glycosyltransferase involved in cell wall biosynthesis